MAVELEAVEVQEIRTLENGLKPYNTIIVGAGTAGIGVTIALQHAGVEDYLLVDRAEVGSSFAAWPADTEIEDSVYTLNLTENRSVILCGFGVYYRDNDLGAIFLPRYEFIPGYTTNLTLEQPLSTYDELPELYFPTETEWESYTTLLTDIVNWIQSYEQRVIEEQGIDYRISTLTEWDNGERKVTSPEKVVAEWEKVGCIISKMQYVDFE